ncbi:MAG: PhoX family protein [Burkholderiaceae bacterium]|nr:PhoX family protein [Burkholderiaceae bacterium]
MTPTRRAMLQRSLALAGAATLGLAQWRAAFASTRTGTGPYGPLGKPDANGVRLPAGFAARLIAVSGQRVAGSSYEWHFQPDGGDTFAMPGGGWVYVSNSELNGTAGGVGAIRFDAAGEIVDAYPILSGTKYNCAGGATPWGTWLSCEEFRNGRVWECDPRQRSQGVVRPALGVFTHEAAVVDPATGIIYMTEDDDTSRLYRFTPRAWGDLGDGWLEAASVDAAGSVTWVPVSSKRPYRGRDSTAFARGEGAWFSGGVLYFCTTSDDLVWALDVARGRLEVIYDAAALGEAAPLREPDNVTVHASSGDIFVCEDDDNLECVLLANLPGGRVAAPFLQFVGHEGSEVAGAAFSPDGQRLFITSQRGIGRKYDSPGMTFEIRGPFRR